MSYSDRSSVVAQAANVLCDDRGHVFLADFGVACSVGDTCGCGAAGATPGQALQDRQAGASRTTPVGTPAYMAPEVRAAVNAYQGKRRHLIV